MGERCAPRNGLQKTLEHQDVGETIDLPESPGTQNAGMRIIFITLYLYLGLQENLNHFQLNQKPMSYGLQIHTIQPDNYGVVPQ